ncbi:nucleotide-binding universal stress UspA family protein [Maribacter caenipelagi]|uniref:Nucleotide-binding universal stress UspA family protein n=1 Tax=Maribacter caenipelagi TaxID=1447781 RepID=A0A4R7DCD8_9FLAO|nr:universal stress protein [Maribacter caenipelagi]TDS16806.1 nucleotide-binding universal stress UspA family protein [Maribacter caenipelagi]
MKNILVATDFSNNSYCALFYATKLLASEPCTFYLLNVFNKMTPLQRKKPKLLVGKNLLEKLQVASDENLTSTKHKIILDNENPQHQFNTISKKGILTKIILKTIYTKQIDLVVMGNKGLNESADIFFGSNTIQVANKIKKCPILAIPGEMEYRQPKEIAFITDFKAECTKKSIEPLLSIASLSNAKIRVLHITEEEILSTQQEANRKLLDICLKDFDHTFYWRQLFDDKAKVIHEFIEKLNIDLYSMVNHPYNLFEKLTHEPVIKDVSMYSETAFLILPSLD